MSGDSLFEVVAAGDAPMVGQLVGLDWFAQDDAETLSRPLLHRVACATLVSTTPLVAAQHKGRHPK